MRFLGVAITLLGAINAVAATARLAPVADTSIVEIVPTNSLGGSAFFTAGTTQAGTRNRGLMRFDPAAVLPRGARIVSAELSVEVVGRPSDGFAAGVFELHRVVRPWGEGRGVSPDAQHPGLGEPARVGEATWLDRLAGGQEAWAEPGGQAGTDFAVEASGEQTVYGLPDSPYVFVSSPRLVADVQAWLDEPASNCGWMLLARDESVRFTARRFASREDVDRCPWLTVEFIPPPGLLGIERVGREVHLRVVSEAGRACVVEWTDRLEPGVAWAVLREIPSSQEPAEVTVVDLLGEGRRFYRLRFAR